MKPLQHPDTLHLQAAQGWLELGNHLEANEELEKVTASLRGHPDVLELRWQIYAHAKKWDACVDIATAITKLAPDRPVEDFLSERGHQLGDPNGEQLRQRGF